MKRTFRALYIISLTLILMLSGMTSASAGNNPFVSPRGSCNSIKGTTVLVSIFVSDPVHSWDFDKKDSMDGYNRIYWRLKTASEWLTRQAGRYGARPKIIWDWFNQPYLYYTYTSSRYLPDQEYTYGELRDFIRDKIDLDKIKRYYNADSAIFFTYYNQTKKDKNGGYAWSWDFNANASEPYAVEIIWITDEDNDLEVSAGGLAHEMMHCFGAVDLYRSSDKVPQKYVNHLKSSRSKDIMYFIDYSTPDTIKEKFTDLDAYYMGLISQCKDQKNYGLIKSSFAD